MTLSRRQHWQAAAIAALGTPIIEAVGATYQWHETGAEHLAEVARQGRQPILALWHGRILAATLYFRDRGVVAVTSHSFDGEWIARLMRRFGYGAARGSSARGGARALAQLRRELRAGSPVAFTVDGPKGPPRIAQAGAAWLAGATGQPIVPFHIESASHWTVKSWDRHQVPRPGTKIAIAIGPALDIAGTTDQEVERGRIAIEHGLARLERVTREMLAGDVK